ncbi:MAG: glycosyltransferase family 4 protein [Acidimicrobiia bacterium]
MRMVVVEPDGSGGMIHYAFQMCSALAEAGADVTLVTSRHYELAGMGAPFRVAPIMRLWPAIEPTARHRGLARLFVWAAHKLRRAERGIRYAREWARATRFILREKPDVAQFAIIRFPFLVWFLRRIVRAGIPISQVCHEFEPRESRSPFRALHRSMTRAAYGYFSVIFLHGEANRARFLELYPAEAARTVVIPHGDESLFLRSDDPGGDLRGRYGIASGKPTALFFGGLRPSKGLDELIDAFALASREIDAHLVVAGPPAGVDPAHLEHRVVRRAISDRVTIDSRYLPFEEVGPLMRTADVVVLPYRSATASGVLQVAYAYGRPVIASELGSLAEDVIHGETGLLVAAGDVPGLASALVKLLGDPAESTRMGACAARAANRYAWPPIARTMLGLYAGVSK